VLAGAQRRRLLWIALAATVVFLALGSGVVYDPLRSIDAAARVAVEPRGATWLDVPMRALSRIGSGYVLLPVGLACCAGLFLRGHRRLAALLVATAAGAQLTTALAKWVIGRPRPNLRMYGYPSGHVLGTVVFFGLLLYLLWGLGAPRGWRWAVTALGGLVTAGVAYSRLYVNAHWTTDVLGGLAAGTALLCAAMVLIDRQQHPAVSKT
jgi:membrane-associated phospholipid phosphatase